MDLEKLLVEGVENMTNKETGLVAKEVAEILGCSEYIVRQKVREGKLPNYRVGRRIFFTRSGIVNWMKEQEQSSIK